LIQSTQDKNKYMDDSWSVKGDVKFEEDLFLDVLGTRSLEIAGLVIAYGLVLDILKAFERIYPQYDIKLDEYYLKLCELIQDNIESIEDEIALRYPPHGDMNFPDFYINTEAFSSFNYPFKNLRDVEIDNSWNEEITKLNKSYGLLRELSHKVGPGDIPAINQKLFDEIEEYIKGVTILECGDLKLNLERGTLQYKLKKLQNVSIATQVVRFLIMLLRSKGKILEYKKVARELDMNFYHKDWNNKETGEELRYLNRDLHTLLKRSGMSKIEIDSYMSIVTNVGYKFDFKCHNKIT
jgi:hypothetical protein